MQDCRLRWVISRSRGCTMTKGVLFHTAMGALLLFVVVLMSSCVGKSATTKADEATAEMLAVEPVESQQQPSEPVEEAAPEPAQPEPEPEAVKPTESESTEAPVEPEKQKKSHVVTGIGEPKFREAVEMASADPDKAKMLFAEALQMDENLYQAHNNIGVIEMWKGQYAQARQSFGNAIRLEPEYEEPYINMAFTWTLQGDRDSACGYLEQQSRKSPELLDVRAASARCMVEQGRVRDGIDEAKSILKEDEHNVRALLAMGWGYYAQGKQELANMVFNTVKTKDPNEAEAYHGMAIVAFNDNRRAEAKAYWQKAVELRPDFPEVHINLGVFYLEDQEFEQALASFDKALTYNPLLVEAYLNRGNALAGLNREKEALAMYEKVEQMDPGRVELLFNRGLMKLQLEPVQEETATEGDKTDVNELVAQVEGNTESTEPKAPDLTRFDEEINELKKKNARIEEGIALLKEYKSKAGNLPDDDPTDQYIKEAENNIKRNEREILVSEKKKQREIRRFEDEQEEARLRAEENAQRAAQGLPPLPEPGSEEEMMDQGLPPEGSETMPEEGVGEAPMEEAPVEEMPEEAAPVEEVPTEDAVAAPVEEAPVEEAPVVAEEPVAEDAAAVPPPPESEDGAVPPPPEEEAVEAPQAVEVPEATEAPVEEAPTEDAVEEAVPEPVEAPMEEAVPPPPDEMVPPPPEGL